MANPNIKILVDVDPTAARNARRLIQEITGDVNKLVEAARLASQTLGGLGGVRVGTAAVRPGTGGTQHIVQTQGSAAGPANQGIFNNIASGLSNIKMAMTGHKAIFKDVSDGLKLLGDSAPQVDKLTASVNNLNNALGNLRGNSAGMGGINVGGAAGGGSNIPGFPSAAMFANAAANFGGGGGGGQPPAGGAGGGGRSGGGIIGGIVGGTLLGYGVRQLVNMTSMPAEMATTAESAQLNAAAGSPMYDMRRNAAWATTFGMESERIRAGRDIRGVAGLVRNPQALAAMREMSGVGYQENLKQASLLAMGDWQQTGSLKGAGSAIMGFLGTSIARIRQSAKEEADQIFAMSIGGPGNKDSAVGLAADKERQANKFYGMTKNDIERTLIEQKIAETLPGRIHEAMTVSEKLDPRFTRMAGDVYSSALGVTGMSRGGFFGFRDYDDYLRRKASAESRGYELGEEGAARSSVVHGIGREYLAASGHVLNMSGGGFANGVGMGSAAARMGVAPGSIAGFLGGVQSTMGAGGIQIGAGNILSGAFAGQMGASVGAGGAGYNYLGAYGQLAGLTSGMGGDQNAAGMMVSGMQNAGLWQSGGKDQLQGNLNMHAGMVAFGGNYAAIDKMASITPVDRLAILSSINNGGKLPQYLADAGVTADSFRSFVKTQNSQALASVPLTSGMSGTNVGKALSAWRGAGGNIKGYLDTMSGSGFDKSGALSALGGAFELANPAGGIRGGIGYANELMAEAGLTSPLTGGGGAMPMGAGGAIRAARKEAAQGVREDAAFFSNEKNREDFAKAIASAMIMARAGDTLGRTGGRATTPEAVEISLKGFVSAINEATRNIKGIKAGQ